MALLLTLTEAKDWLGIPLTDTTKDALVTGLIASVTAAVEAWTDTPFGATTATTNEILDARRQDVIVPEGSPLVSVQQVVLGVNSDGSGGTILDATAYVKDEVAIRLIGMNLPQARGYVRIDYTWGYATIPANVKLAAQLSVDGYYRMRARQGVGVTAKSKEGESISFKDAWHSEAGLPNEAIGLLSSYRIIDFGSGRDSMATRNS